jgi:hypothetical protein
MEMCRSLCGRQRARASRPFCGRRNHVLPKLWLHWSKRIRISTINSTTGDPVVELGLTDKAAYTDPRVYSGANSPPSRILTDIVIRRK